MALEPGRFYQIPDNRGDDYFTFIGPEESRTVNTTIPTDIVNFLQEEMDVTPRATTVLTRDLTPRDDVLIAVISLLLILCIEGIVTTVLMRTARGSVSNFGFSVKQFVELVRDFRFRHLLHGRNAGLSGPRGINPKLLLVAVFFLVSTFAVEVLVLFLSAPTLLEVSNSDFSFGLRQPLNPDWRLVRFHSRASMFRPCTALSLRGVEQGRTSISTCLTSTVRVGTGKIFEKTEGDVEYEITTDLHKYGAEHKVKVGEIPAAHYSARCYFSLLDNRERLMSERGEKPREEMQVYQIHKQYLAFLFTSYLRATKDKKRITADVLNSVNDGMTHKPSAGGRVKVIKVRGKDEYETVSYKRYVTTFTAPSVGDAAALTYAQAVFKSSIGVQVDRGSERDLVMGSGRLEEHRGVGLWREEARDLSWFSLSLALILSLIALAILRAILRPVGTIDIAGAYVKELVGADQQRAPLQMDDRERPYFYIGYVSNGTDYRYGAETDDGWKRVMEEEYDGKP